MWRCKWAPIGDGQLSTPPLPPPPPLFFIFPTRRSPSRDRLINLNNQTARFWMSVVFINQVSGELGCHMRWWWCRTCSKKRGTGEIVILCTKRSKLVAVLMHTHTHTHKHGARTHKRVAWWRGRRRI